MYGGGATNQWSLYSKLLAPDFAAYDAFGSSIAVSSSTALIGAPSTLTTVPGM